MPQSEFPSFGVGFLNTAMDYLEIAGLLRGMTTRFGLCLPGLAAVIESAGSGTYRVAEGISYRDRALLRLRLRLIRDLLQDTGSTPGEVAQWLDETTRVLTDRLEKELAGVYARTRKIEAAWRGLAAYMQEADPEGNGISLWIWNGTGEGWITAMVTVDPIFVVTPGRAEAPRCHGRWSGVYPEPIAFGDMQVAEAEAGLSHTSATGSTTVATAAMSVRDDEQRIVTRSGTGAAGPRASVDSTLPPSRFAVCVNELEGRPAYPWEPEPLWIRSSFAVAGVHVRQLRQGCWGSTGSGPVSGRLLSLHRTRERLTVTRAERLRDAAWIPLSTDNVGVMALGDSTRPCSGYRSVGLTSLKLQAATARWIRRRVDFARPTVPEEATEPGRHAEKVLSVIEERRFVQRWNVQTLTGSERTSRIRVSMTADDHELSMELELARGVPARVPTPTTTSIPVSGPTEVPVPVPGIEEPVPAAHQGAAEFLRSLLARLFRNPGRDASPGSPADRK